MPGLIRARSKGELKTGGGKPRNYKREYRKFQSSRSSKQDRASRNKVRRQYLKKGLVKKGDKRDIHHANGRPQDNSSGNLRVISRSRNRSIR